VEPPLTSSARAAAHTNTSRPHSKQIFFKGENTGSTESRVEQRPRGTGARFKLVEGALSNNRFVETRRIGYAPRLAQNAAR
jgi:hypothetical protein